MNPALLYNHVMFVMLYLAGWVPHCHQIDILLFVIGWMSLPNIDLKCKYKLLCFHRIQPINIQVNVDQCSHLCCSSYQLKQTMHPSTCRYRSSYPSNQWYHVIMNIYFMRLLFRFFLERKPCTICSLVFLVAMVCALVLYTWDDRAMLWMLGFILIV